MSVSSISNENFFDGELELLNRRELVLGGARTVAGLFALCTLGSSVGVQTWAPVLQSLPRFTPETTLDQLTPDTLDVLRNVVLSDIELSSGIQSIEVTTPVSYNAIAVNKGINLARLLIANGPGLEAGAKQPRDGSRVWLPYQWSPEVDKFLQIIKINLHRIATQIYGDPVPEFNEYLRSGLQNIPIYPMQDLVYRQRVLGYFVSPTGAGNYPWGIYVDFSDSNWVEAMAHEYGHAFLEIGQVNPFNPLSQLFDVHKIVDLMGIAVSRDMGFRNVDNEWVWFSERADQFNGLQGGLRELEMYNNDADFYKQIRMHINDLVLNASTGDDGKYELATLHKFCENVFPGFTDIIARSGSSVQG